MSANKYTDEQIRGGLLAVAAFGGNAEAASRHLKELDRDVPASTLRHWRNVQYPGLYNELHERHGRDIEQALIPEIRDTALLAAKGTRLAVQASIDELEAGQTKDVATTARNLATVTGINIDKLMLTTDRPTERTDNPNARLILSAITARLGIPETTDTTYEEDPPQVSSSEPGV